MNILEQYTLGDMLLSYVADPQGRVGMQLIPAERAGDVLEKEWAAEPLVQLHAHGDQLPNGYGNGHTLATTPATDRMKPEARCTEGDAIITRLTDGAGRTVYHKVRWHEGTRALRVSTVFENTGSTPVVLDLLSSLNLGSITPFTEGDASGALRVHRARSAWSAEGRLQTDTVEHLHLERSWTGHALRVEKFGQLGSMPVRGWFPFAAVEDTHAGVCWAMQLACPSSWQMELRRRDDGLCMMASLSDEDYGHWCKTILPGERFETPEAYLTVCSGGVDAASQRLLSLHRENWVGREKELPVLFNEYCTTWGDPCHANMVHIADTLKGKGIDYLVMDAGWYARDGIGWSDAGGDWIPNETTLFPEGIKATADYIKAAGMKPGIWFEAETCAGASDTFHREELLLKRGGRVIDTANRRFLDLRKEEVHAHLEERVISLLNRAGFRYVKIDYNCCIGMGCDDPDSLGEGLRQNMQGALRFFRRMREAVPGLAIENCSSGGHRLEPSLMAVSDMASFSDAHECPEIPIIAANLHRLILPGQSQIWAVLRASDSLRRLNYSLVNTFLGVLCLSGDVDGLSPAHWAKVEEGIAFFKAVRHIIRDGESAFHGKVSEAWRKPEGWQAVCRSLGCETLSVIHTFGGEHPGQVRLPVKGKRILRVMCSEDNAVHLEDGELVVELKAPFEAVAVLTGE
ncbi:MAG: alpha-galactosidase [Clostridiales bacterium]|nr:alpha-galactosidase [Clostridiales bacterium]